MVLGTRLVVLGFAFALVVGVSLGESPVFRYTYSLPHVFDDLQALGLCKRASRVSNLKGEGAR